MQEKQMVHSKVPINEATRLKAIQRQKRRNQQIITRLQDLALFSEEIDIAEYAEFLSACATIYTKDLENWDFIKFDERKELTINAINRINKILSIISAVSIMGDFFDDLVIDFMKIKEG